MVQKHQYLIGVLQGEAHSVIQGFKISNENYESTWKLLKNTYDNNNDDYSKSFGRVVKPSRDNKG